MTKVAGNFENKYHSSNPLSKYLMRNFIQAFQKLILKIDLPQKILEVGAGEGNLAKIVRQTYSLSEIIATDISSQIIEVAQKNLKGSRISFDIEDVEHLTFKDNTFDLVVCCEVLEHTDNPSKSLSEIKRVTKKWAILSVPQEPMWRVLNMARGKYLKNFGNTPGHINHWNYRKFLQLIEQAKFKVIKIERPFPWTMVLVEK